MTGFPVTCATLIKNTGLSDCSVDVGFDVGHIFVPRGTEIDTAANAALLATWQTLIQADVGTRIYPLPPSVKQEFTEDEPVYEALAQGQEQYLYTNTSKDRFFISSTLMTPTFNSNIQSLNNGIWAAYIFTSGGFLKGKSIDGTKFLPIDVDIRIEPQRKATDAEGSHLPYTVRPVDYKDWNENGAYVDPSFNPSTDLEGLINVNLAVSGTPTAIELILVATTELNSIAVTGLVVADFLLKTAAGAEQAPSSVTESPSGTYTLVTVGGVTGTANLQLPSAMTTEGYEGVEVDYTI